MKGVVVWGLLSLSFSPTVGQHRGCEKAFFDKPEVGQDAPEGLLEGRSVVLYNPTRYSYPHLVTMQQAFQHTGIDAVAYFTCDMVFANPDAIRSASTYFNKRGISFLIFPQKKDSLFSLLFTRFSGDESLIDTHRPAWRVDDVDLNRLLNKVYRLARQSQSKKNLLINDIPENDFVLPIVKGRVFSSFPLDLKVDRLAVPLFGGAVPDTSLVDVFRTTYSLPFDTVRQASDIAALRKAGFLYVLKYVYAREATIRALLHYPEPSGNTFMKHGDQRVYKFYVQSLVSGNVFLGTEWGTDTDMRTGLLHYIHALKKELGLINGG